MHRIALLLFTCMLLTAGCLSTMSSQAQHEGIQLITPASEKPIFDGQATYFGLIGDETPQIKANYSTGEVIIHPGNGTTLHHLIGTTELAYILSGEANISVDNESIIAGKGETVLLPENVMQSIAAVGNVDLHYITVIQPPFTSTIEIHENESTPSPGATNKTPIVVSNPHEGIEWDSGTGVTVYTLINAELMPEREIPINYSIAYSEYLPGGYLGYDGLNGSSDFLYVISGEIEVSTPDGETLKVPAGSAAFVSPGVVKMTRNTADSTTTLLSFVDPAWTVNKTALWN